VVAAAWAISEETEAAALGLTEADVWDASKLHYDRPVVKGWTRADLRELGYGKAIDQHIQAGFCAPDGCRRRPSSAEVVKSPREWARKS
jgi:hypothetical protein